MKNILDALMADYNSDDNDEEGVQVSVMSENIIVPKRCALCKIAIVCSVLPTFISLSKIGIFLSLDKCPFNSPIKNEKQNSTKI